MNYFISDLHFGHFNIIGFDNRPFKNVEEMDTVLIENWNKTVCQDDTVYILGDFSWYKADKTTEILKLLNGHKRLIKGNHDKFLHNADCKKQFESIVDYDEVVIDGRKVVLSHYPITFFNGHYYKGIHLYGHVHNSHEWDFVENTRLQLKEMDIPCDMYNVGCMIDYMNYAPRTLEEIINKTVDRSEV